MLTGLLSSSVSPNGPATSSEPFAPLFDPVEAYNHQSDQVIHRVTVGNTVLIYVMLTFCDRPAIQNAKIS